MQRSVVLLATLVLVLLGLVVLPSPTTADQGGFAFTAGIPARFAGAVLATADQGYVVARDLPSATTFTFTTAQLDVVTTRSSYLDAAGNAIPAHSDTTTNSHQLDAGALSLRDAGSDFLVVGEGARLVLESRAGASAPREVWSHANVQVTTLIHDLRLDSASSTAPLLGDPGQALPAGTYEARTGDGTAALAPERVTIHDATVAYGGQVFQARAMRETRPGSVPVPDALGGAPTWTGPGEHVEETIAIITVRPTNGAFSLAAAGAPVAAYADDFRLELDGFVQFPWAEGQIHHGADEVRIDGDQVLLQGTVRLRTISKELDDSPAIGWLGAGDLALVQLGPLPDATDVNGAALVAAGAGAATLSLAAAIYYWPLLKYGLSGLLVPLYARVPRERVLDHHGREVVYQRIKQEPGISTHRLASTVEFGWSTLAYHLRVLERNQLVISVRDGRYKRFFDRESGKYANGRKYAVVVLRNETTFGIARAVLERPGTTQKELSEKFQLSPSTVHWHVERLQDANLTVKDRDGHNVRYRPGPAWSEVDPQDVGLDAAYLAAFGPRIPMSGFVGNDLPVVPGSPAPH